DMLRLSRRCGVWPDRDVIKYIRSAIAIDGLITRLAPAFDITTYMSTVCSTHLHGHVRSNLFALNTLVSAAAAIGRALGDGLARGSTVLDQLATTGLPARMDIQREPIRAAGGRARVLAVGIAALAAGVIGSRIVPANFGPNTFTACAI